MKYCSHCGARVSQKIPTGDNRLRYICDVCETIHYQNPKIVAGTLPVYQDKILLCRRAIEPRKGFWTLPAGFMENQETTTQAAIRETYEEAKANITIEGLYTMINVPDIDQVHIFFIGAIENGIFGVGEESLEVQLFSEEDIPWDKISFPTVHKTLKLYFSDRKENQYPLHVEDIIRKHKS